MAEEELSKAKVAAKKAKKHRQKAKKGQQGQLACQHSPNADSVVCVDSHNLSTPFAAAVRISDTSPGLQQHLDVQQLTRCSETDAANAIFLDELFCCPLTQVCCVVIDAFCQVLSSHHV